MTKDNHASLEIEIEEDEDFEDYKFDQAGYDAYVNEEDDEGDFAYELAPYTRRQLATSGLGGQLSKIIEKYIKMKKVPEDEKLSIANLDKENNELELEVNELDKSIFDNAVLYRENIKVYAKYKSDLENLVVKEVLIEKNDDFDVDGEPEVEPDDVKSAKDAANELFQALNKLEDSRRVLNLKRRSILAKIGAQASLDESSHYEKLLEAIDKKIFGIDNVYEITKEKVTKEDEELFLDSLESFADLADGKLTIEELLGEEDYALASDEHTTEEIFTIELNKALHEEKEESFDFFKERSEAYQHSKSKHPAQGLGKKETDDSTAKESLKIHKVIEAFNHNNTLSQIDPVIYLSLLKKYDLDAILD